MFVTEFNVKSIAFWYRIFGPEVFIANHKETFLGKKLQFLFSFCPAQ